MKTQTLHSTWHPAARASKKILIVMHGRGDSPAGFGWLPSALGFSDLNYLMLRAPDTYYTGYSWYDLPPDQGPGIIRSRNLLDKLISEVIDAGYQTEDCILFGFSQGCLMVLEWGARTDHRFAGLVGISGYCYDPKKLVMEMTAEARTAHWLMTHGTQDEVLAFDITAGQVAFLKNSGLPLAFKTYAKGHTIDDRQEMPMLIDWIAERLRLSRR